MRLLRILCVACSLAVLAFADRSEECCCDSEVLDSHNKSLFDLFHQIRERNFFSLFQVDLFSESCPIKGRHSPKCGSEGCAVCEDLPDVPLCQQQRKDQIDFFVSPSAKKWLPPPDEDLWIAANFDDVDERQFFDLRRNPERDTGYVGEAAHSVWRAIYEQNCFHEGDTECLEERAFYRIISGLHCSVGLHVARDKGTLGELALRKKHPDRVQNLYFAYALMLRAVSKARNVLLDYQIDTGSPEDDLLAKEQLRELLQHPVLRDCADRSTFDEAALFQDEALKAEFKERFRSTSALIHCVDCDSCRLHGKLQILGLGTAMKVLWTNRSLQASDLTHDEVVALTVTASKFGSAIEALHIDENLSQRRVLLQVLLSTISLVTAAIVTLRYYLPN